MKICALISSGKDSLYAAYLASRENEIVCFLTMISKNKDSYMFHTPSIELVKYQAESAGVPLIEVETAGEKEKELLDLKKGLLTAKERYGIEGIVSGALYSNYQKERIDKLAEEVGLESLAPLWHMDQKQEVEDLISTGFKIIFTKIAAYGLSKKWLNVEIGKSELEQLSKIAKSCGINISGEGGEYESLVLDCPMFHKIIKIIDSEIEEESEDLAFLKIKRVKLLDKNKQQVRK